MISFLSIFVYVFLVFVLTLFGIKTGHNFEVYMLTIVGSVFLSMINLPLIKISMSGVEEKLLSVIASAFATVVLVTLYHFFVFTVRLLKEVI